MDPDVSLWGSRGVEQIGGEGVKMVQKEINCLPFAPSGPLPILSFLVTYVVFPVITISNQKFGVTFYGKFLLLTKKRKTLPRLSLRVGSQGFLQSITLLRPSYFYR